MQLSTRHRHLVIGTRGLRLEIDDHIEAKSTFYYEVGDPRLLGAALMKFDQAAECTKWLDGQPAGTMRGRETLAGLSTVSVDRGGPSNKHTAWMAPSLGCIIVKTEAHWGDNGAGSSVSIASPDYVKVGEANESLFTIPDGYEEMKPSESHKRNVEYMGLKPSAQQEIDNSKHMLQADAAYNRKR